MISDHICCYERTTDTWYVCGMFFACFWPWCGGGRSSNRRLERDLDWSGLPRGRDHQAAAWTHAPLPGRMACAEVNRSMAWRNPWRTRRSEAKQRPWNWPGGAIYGSHGWLRMLAVDVGQGWFSVKRPEHDMPWLCHGYAMPFTFMAASSPTSKKCAGKTSKNEKPPQMSCWETRKFISSGSWISWISSGAFAQATEALQLQCQRGGEHPI